MNITQQNINLINLELSNLEDTLKLTPKIKEVIKQFENKTFSKRVESKLKEIDDNIYFSIDSNDFLSLKYYYKKRCIQGVNSWVYIRETHSLIFMELIKSIMKETYQKGLKEDKKIDSAYIIEQIEKWEEYTKNKIKIVKNELNNLEQLKQDFEEYTKAKQKLESHHYTIKTYFEIK